MSKMILKVKKVCLGLICLLLMLFVMVVIGGDTTAKAAVTTKEVTATANCTSAEIQNLLDLNKEGNYNLIVNIPEGTYNLDKELRIYSNTSIIADPNAKLMRNHTKGAMLANDLSKDAGGYNTTVNISVTGGIWDASKVWDSIIGSESFRFIHASNVVIKEAIICNVPNGSHLITLAGVRNAIIDDCRLFGYRGTMLKEAIHLDIVHDNAVVPSLQSKSLVYDDLVCDNIQITNCQIYDYPRGIGSHTSIQGVYHKNIKITNNQLHDLKEAGIKAYNYQNLTIEGNSIYKGAVGILVYTSIDNGEEHYLTPLKTTQTEEIPENYFITIRNNEISEIAPFKVGNATLWGDAIRIIGSKERPLTGVLCDSNRINTMGRYGIFIEEAPEAVVTNSMISDTKKNAIYLINGCDKSEVSNNKIENAGEKGSTEGGIGVLNSNKLSIISNTVTNPAKNGVFLYNKSTSCSITNNIIVGAGENGIGLYHQSNDATVTLNQVANYKLHGIFAYQVGSATITDNKINAVTSSGSQDAIHVNADKSSRKIFRIQNNVIATANRHGMYVKNAPKVNIEGNNISKTIKHAIYLDAGCKEGMVQKNTIKNAGKTGSNEGGIGVSNSSKVMIYKNTVKNAAKNGIFLYNQSTSCTIKGNTISNSMDNAISINQQSNKAIITENVITGNKKSNMNNRGIFVYQSDDAVITKNKITSCKKNHEININSSKGSKVKENTIK